MLASTQRRCGVLVLALLLIVAIATVDVRTAEQK